MTQTTPQFTAAQILEAGRRAESDGRLEYAIQFYRHLADHHARTPEAQSAREGLARLANRRPGEAAANGAPTVNGSHHSSLNATHAGAPSVKPDAATAGSPSTPPILGQQTPIGPQLTPPPLPEAARRPSGSVAGPIQAPAPVAQPSRTIAISPLGAPAATVSQLPPAAEGYRAGRVLAKILNVIGWLAFGASVLLLLLSLGAMFAPMAPPMSNVLRVVGPSVAVGGAITGLFTIFVAQMARALFDTANATRDLVAIERAKADRR